MEKERSFGNHTSSRNSEVIHSGIYYKPGSLKAKLCVEGRDLLYKYCEDNSVEHRRCEKLIVARRGQEAELYKLYANGVVNGLSGLTLLSAAEIKEREPDIKSSIIRAIRVPSTGIVDSHQLMASLEKDAADLGAVIVYDTEVDDVEYLEGIYTLHFSGEDYTASAPVVINCAGLWAHKLSELAGVAGYEAAPCKGEYFRTTRYKNMKSLIYPLPEEDSLGIHTCLSLSGDVSFGPNAYFVNDLDYNINESNKDQFLKEISDYLDVGEGDLSPDYAGIRPKIKGSKDFIIKNEKDKGRTNFINLLGIESPGLTSCLSVAKLAIELIEGGAES